MQSEILSWLKNPQDYFSGLQLLEQSCKNEFLLRMLRKGPTAFNRETLQEELQRIADKASKPKIQSTGQFQIRSAEHFNSLPQQVKDLQDEKDRIYKEMSFLHSQLELYKTDEQRQEPALRILDLDDQACSI